MVWAVPQPTVILWNMVLAWTSDQLSGLSVQAGSRTYRSSFYCQIPLRYACCITCSGIPSERHDLS